MSPAYASAEQNLPNALLISRGKWHHSRAITHWHTFRLVVKDTQQTPQSTQCICPTGTLCNTWDLCRKLWFLFHLLRPPLFMFRPRYQFQEVLQPTMDLYRQQQRGRNEKCHVPHHENTKHRPKVLRCGDRGKSELQIKTQRICQI